MKPMQLAIALLLAALPIAFVAAQKSPDPLSAGLSCPLKAKAMARLELLFGAARQNGQPISDTEWQTFLDAEVTPRFPDGLTVLGGSGQWRSPTGTIVKEGSKVLLVWLKPGPDAEARVEAIRAAYKARFVQESVMRVDSLSCVAFQ